MMSEPVTLRSSNLRTVAYDDEQMVLEVEFTSGARYRFSGVPTSVFDSLRTASSPGGYFAAVIRDKYAFTRV